MSDAEVSTIVVFVFLVAYGLGAWAGYQCGVERLRKRVEALEDVLSLLPYDPSALEEKP